MRNPISPLDLRKRNFSKRLNGFDQIEVTQYLETLAEDLEDIYRRLDEYDRENTRLKDENLRHRESEATLKETLMLAQKSADALKAAAEREARTIVEEARHRADRMIEHAEEHAEETEKRIRELRIERRNFQVKLQGMIDLFQQVLNFDREDDELGAAFSSRKAPRTPSGQE